MSMKLTKNVKSKKWGKSKWGKINRLLLKKATYFPPSIISDSIIHRSLVLAIINNMVINECL